MDEKLVARVVINGNNVGSKQAEAAGLAANSRYTLEGMAIFLQILRVAYERLEQRQVIRSTRRGLRV